jgi:CubicO group peptidase (beta-lactamase class C family)
MRLRALFLLLALGSSASAQSSGPSNSPNAAETADASERVKEIFASYDHTDTPGCAVGVSLAGAEVLRGAWGMADLEHHVALTPDSVLEAGSVSKQFTAAAVLLLAERGKLSVNDPVRKYMPELPDYGTPITIDHLLHHTSGLRDWSSVVEAEGWPRSTREYNNAWVLDITSRQKSLNYRPGDDWSYTNTGYNLLAILVQRVSGKSLAQFTNDNIFLPLGMQTTGWRDDFKRIVPNRAIAYEQTNGTEHQLMPFENAYGNGGLLTTVDDLLRWNDRFSAQKLGDSSFVKSELEPGRLNDGRSLFYAAGLFLTEHDGTREISHSGATAGYRAWLAFYPDRQLSVAVLCNAAEANTMMLGHKVVDVYLLLPISQPPAKPHDTALTAGLEGLYEDRRDHTTISINRKDGKLIANGKFPLIPVSATTFRLTPEGNLFQIKTDAGGKPVSLGVSSFGFDLDILDRVDRATPSEAEIQAMTGHYVSDEAETEFNVTLTPKGLEIHQRPDVVYSLKPTYAGGFESELGSVRFLRDASGQITGLSLGDSRMWDLRFRRVEAK